jgi:hypothetical protein
MTDEIRRARLLREMEQEFIPLYDATTTPPADKRAAYALEHIAFRMGRIEKQLETLISTLAQFAPNKAD